MPWACQPRSPTLSPKISDLSLWQRRRRHGAHALPLRPRLRQQAPRLLRLRHGFPMPPPNLPTHIVRPNTAAMWCNGRLLRCPLGSTRVPGPTGLASLGKPPRVAPVTQFPPRRSPAQRPPVFSPVSQGTLAPPPRCSATSRCHLGWPTSFLTPRPSYCPPASAHCNRLPVCVVEPTLARFAAY